MIYSYSGDTSIFVYWLKIVELTTGLDVNTKKGVYELIDGYNK